MKLPCTHHLGRAGKPLIRSFAQLCFLFHAHLHLEPSRASILIFLGTIWAVTLFSLGSPNRVGKCFASEILPSKDYFPWRCWKSIRKSIAKLELNRQQCYAKHVLLPGTTCSPIWQRKSPMIAFHLRGRGCGAHHRAKGYFQTGGVRGASHSRR